MTAAEIGLCLGMSARTCSRIVRRAGLGRLRSLEPAEPVVRYGRACPGELVHVLCLVALAAVALLAWGLLVIVRGEERSRARTVDQPSSRIGAEEILAERLARGELDPSEYDERLKALHRAPDVGARPT